ncbi:hypothetical protein V6N13_097197 [Hibiscus sabdariffa]
MSNVERMRRHVADDSSCKLCGAAMEDTYHILRSCSMVIPIWMEFIRPEKMVSFFGLNIHDWLLANLGQDPLFARIHLQWDLLFGALIWNIWLQRNWSIFEDTAYCTGSIVIRSFRLLEEISLAGDGQGGVSSRESEEDLLSLDSGLR